MTTVRQLVADLAKSYAGVGDAPETRTRYCDLIAPIELEGGRLQAQMEHMYSCALTVLGFMRKLGLTDGMLHRAYVISRAMSDCVDVAVAHGAWRQSRKPGMGDFVMIDGGFHIFTIVSDVGEDGGFHTVEGGNKDAKGNMCIVAGYRRFRPDGTLTNESSSARHTVFAWIDCTALGISVPQDELVDEKPTDKETCEEGLPVAKDETGD